MIFEEQKKKQLMKKDLSNEGSWDVKIKSLCKKLNKKKNYYTFLILWLVAARGVVRNLILNSCFNSNGAKYFCATAESLMRF